MFGTPQAPPAPSSYNAGYAYFVTLEWSSNQTFGIEIVLVCQNSMSVLCHVCTHITHFFSLISRLHSFHLQLAVQINLSGSVLTHVIHILPKYVVFNKTHVSQ